MVLVSSVHSDSTVSVVSFDITGTWRVESVTDHLYFFPQSVTKKSKIPAASQTNRNCLLEVHPVVKYLLQ